MVNEKLKTVNLDSKIHKIAKRKSIDKNMSIKEYLENLIAKDNKKK